MINNVTSFSKKKTKASDKNDSDQAHVHKNMDTGKSTLNKIIELRSKAKKTYNAAKNILLESKFNDIKIAKIKQSIANDKYKINVHDITKKILNDL